MARITDNLRKWFQRTAPLKAAAADPSAQNGLALFQAPEIDETGFPDDPPSFNIPPVSYMKRYRFVPLSENEGRITVAMADPFDLNTRESVMNTYQKPIDVVMATEELILQHIYRWFEAEVDIAADEETPGMDLGEEDQLWDNTEQLIDMASEAPVIRLVNHVISKALHLGASDVHVEPRKTTVQVRYRIDGILHDQEAIARKLKAAITSRIKLISKMDIAEMRLPQDGRIKFRSGKQEVDIRVSCIPTHYGESLVLRLLHKEDVQLDLTRLGFPSGILDRFKRTITLPYGMMLVTGPTGSGKTTTLYAALNLINQPDKKIVTVEDPVEYQLDGANQVQVQPNIGLTFASALRSFLRHDPDVMLVGEIRDLETAEIAVQSALTGHMVFSTLHTNDAAGAITRLEEVGVERFMVVSSLVAVLAQRLVRTICPDCRVKVQVTRDQRQVLARELGVGLEDVLHSYYKGEGCKECAGTGYRGRTGIYEFLPMTDSVQREVLRGADREAIFRQAVSEGMVSLRMSGLEKVKLGKTTYEEVLRVTR